MDDGKRLNYIQFCSSNWQKSRCFRCFLNDRYCEKLQCISIGRNEISFTYNREQSKAIPDVGNEGEDPELASRPCHYDDEFNTIRFIKVPILYTPFIEIPGISTIDSIMYKPVCNDQSQAFNLYIISLMEENWWGGILFEFYLICYHHIHRKTSLAYSYVITIKCKFIQLKVHVQQKEQDYKVTLIFRYSIPIYLTVCMRQDKT